MANGGGAETLGLQLGDLVSFGTGEVWISWHGNIVFLFGDKRISNPQTVLHLTPEFTESLANQTPADVYHGRGAKILKMREEIKKQTIRQRRLQHQAAAA